MSRSEHELTAVVIEDELHGRQALLSLITSNTNIKVIGEAEDIDSGIELLLRTKPDVVFLDIRLGNRSGFDIIKQIPNKDFSLVITSAYEEYALQAIREEAVDYLLKPVTKDDLLRTVLRIRERRDKNNYALEHSWPSLQKSIGQSAWDKISIASATGISFIPVTQILRCISDGPYTKVVLKGSLPLTSSRNLGEYENLLTPDMGFLRVHHNVIVNMREVLRYIRGEGGNVIMSDGEKVDVSRRKKAELMDWIEKRGL